MAERKRGRLIGCLVGCFALALIGAGVAVVGVVIVGGAGAGVAVWTLDRSMDAKFEEVARAIEAPPPAPVIAPVPEVAPVAVELGPDGLPIVVGPDGLPIVDGTATDGTTADGTATDGTATEGTGTEGTIAPAPAPSGTGDVVPAPAPAPAPVTAPAPAPAPAPSPAPLTRPSPAPAPTPAPMTRASGAKVTVEGAASVVLVGGDGKRHTLPASVPSGSYTMEATFSDGVPVNVGKLTVEEGGSHVVRCNENMGICRGS